MTPKKFFFSFFSIISIIGYGVFVFAAPPGVGGYNPGEILDPECAPNAPDCIVALPGGGTVTADNGLTVTGSNVQLGGVLLQDTTIDQDGNDFLVQDGDYFFGKVADISTLLPFPQAVPFIGSGKVNPFSGTDMYMNGYFESVDPRYLLLVNKGVFNHAMVIDGNNDGFEFSSSDTELGSTVNFRVNDIQLKHNDSLTGESMALFVRSTGIEFISESGSYLFPRTDGITGQVLSTDGSGQLSWVTNTGGSGIAGIGTINSLTRSANGAGISGGNLILQTGNRLLPGLLVGETDASGVTLGIGAGVGADTVNGVFVGVNAGNGAYGLVGSNFIGSHAGYNAYVAFDSNFIGRFAGAYAEDADHSAFIGANAGNSATSARYSVFIGEDTGRNAVDAYHSIFLGYGAGKDAASASNSVFIGEYAGNGAVNAANSIFIGTQAGYLDTVNNTVAGESILIGNGTSTGGNSNSIALGTGAINTAPNQFMIGSVTVPINEVVIKGTGTCSIAGTGISCSSDERLKTNIENLEITTLETLTRVRSVRYNWHTNPNGEKIIGFLAQDLEQYYPELVRTDSDGYKMVNYAQMTPIIVEAIREMNLNIGMLSDMTRSNTWRDGLIAWFGNVENGITDLYAKIIHTDRVETKELCVGSVCVTEDQFLQVMNQSGQSEIIIQIDQPVVDDSTPVINDNPENTDDGSVETTETDQPANMDPVPENNISTEEIPVQ